jgi:flagellar basal-body rod protein FlgF
MVKDWLCRREEFAGFRRTPAGRALPTWRVGGGDFPEIHHGMQRAFRAAEAVLQKGAIVENTFLVGLSQQIAARRSMEVIANNLANLSTPSFKRESVQFEQYMTRLPATEAEGGGTVDVAFVLDRGVVRDLSTGRFERTNGVLDFALSGPGYFVVESPEGERYTRNGHFQLDNQGRVVTDDGYVVQSDGGAIAIQQQDSDIQVGPDGTISIKNQVGAAVQLLGKMRIVTFADERLLQKTGASLFDAGGQTAIAATAETRVHQGVIEKSNVEPVVEITKMIDVLRAYQAVTEMTQESEDMYRRALEQLATVPQA